jgi:integrase
MRLTDKAIATIALPAGKSEYTYFDDAIPGFGYRLRSAGAARWIFQYNVGKRTRRLTLGPPSALSATRARTIAGDLYAKVRLGADPAGEKAESRMHAAETFGALVSVYLQQQRESLKPKSFVQVERHLLKYCRALHSMGLTQIDRRAIAARLMAVATKSGRVTSNRLRASLSAFFTWCIGQGFADSNPVTGTTRHPEKSRARVLNPDELRAIWNATAGTDDYSQILRLLLLTGCRLNEIGWLSWSEIFGDRIVLPGTRVKNGRDHIVPLTEPAQAILAAWPKMLGSDFVFGRGAKRGRGFTGHAEVKILLDKRIKASGAKMSGHWTNHDIRRTVATGMAELSVQPHIIEAVLNQVSGHKRGVAGIYNRASYENEKRAALTAWASRLAEIVEGKEAPRKVVSLRA